ncbi:protein-tyrosine phosphatase-like protein [Rhodocollybia butyracea]|uniref:Protein-tyrosine phosphatase-like protein n=1 Tax=Rhodocollybia butyracea TaxID=206335 RepID=A0A9P5PQ30_9AGAR|nr:protein-tyrosine phosphatase-like protein [Rhodocollybia butyracea]
MSSSLPAHVPAWLQAAYTTPRVKVALKALAERENARTKFRAGHIKSARNAAKETGVVQSTAANISSHFHNSDPSNYYSILSGLSQENMQRNRYMDVIPYDRTLVVAKGLGAGTGSEAYLNANWVQEKYGKRWWIASQAPLQNTAYTFLSLLLDDDEYPPESKSHSASQPRTVVQLTQTIESGRRKAHPYFPDIVGQTMIIVSDSPSDPSSPIRKLKVTLLSQEKLPNARCVKSIVEVRPVGAPIPKPTIFTHLLFIAWPDQSVPSPSDRAALFEFVRLVDQVNRSPPVHPRHNTNNNTPDDLDPPIVVGCSAGIGRTGSFIAISSLLRHAGFFTQSSPIASKFFSIQSGNSDNNSSSPLPPFPSSLSDDLVACEIDSLREQRAGMVQRPEQAVLVYEMLVGAYVERRDGMR